MNPVAASALYWVVQIVIWIYALYALTRLRERQQSTTIRRDPPAARIFLMLAVPAISFGYFMWPSLAAHTPIERDQVWLSVIVTAIASIVMVLRFRRQDRANSK